MLQHQLLEFGHDHAIFQIFGAIDKWGSICECVGHIQHLTMSEFVQGSQLFGTESLAWVIIM
jgi:hypothetical protein